MTFKELLQVFPESYKEFTKNDPLRMGSSVAFFSIFAIPAILFILVHLFGALFGERIISGEFFEEIEGVFGEDTAENINEIFTNLQQQADNTWMIIGGIIFFTFVATTFFSVIVRSLNQIWGIKPEGNKMWLKKLRSRGKSFVLILLSGIIFFFALFIDYMVYYLGEFVIQAFPFLSFSLLQIISYMLILAIVAFWFSLLFKYLPDANIDWGPSLVGGFVTAVLFVLGKLILQALLVDGNIDDIYGAWSTVIIVLLFIFYSSMIIFYGAAFTKCYASAANHRIEPKEYAFRYQISEQKE